MRGALVHARDFAGGLNLVDLPYALAENEASDLMNVSVSRHGKLRQRDGHRRLAYTSTVIPRTDSLFTLGRMPDGFDYLIAQSYQSLIAWDISVDFGASGQGIYGGQAATVVPLYDFARVPVQAGQGPLVAMNGVNAIQWTGTGQMTAFTANSGSRPIGKYLVYQQNRLWVAGMTAYTPSGGSALADPGSTLVFSEPGAPRDFPATNVVQFDPNDGEAISGIGTVGPYLLVAKPSKIWLVYDLDTGANRRLATNTGCVSHRTIVETPKGTLLLSKDQGVLVCDGNSVKPLSQKVQPAFDQLGSYWRSNAAAAWWHGRYLIALPWPGASEPYQISGLPYNDVLYDYDLDTGSWWRHNTHVTQFAVMDVLEKTRLYAGHPNAGVGAITPYDPTMSELFLSGRTTDFATISDEGMVVDAGVPITSYWISNYHDFGDPARRKRLRRARVTAAGKIGLRVIPGYGQSPLTQRQFTLGANPIPAEILTPGVARQWALRVDGFGTDALSTSGFEVESYSLALTGRKD